MRANFGIGAVVIPLDYNTATIDEMAANRHGAGIGKT
jgi:hypothetical protein